PDTVVPARRGADVEAHVGVADRRVDRCEVGQGPIDLAAVVDDNDRDRRVARPDAPEQAIDHLGTLEGLDHDGGVPRWFHAEASGTRDKALAATPAARQVTWGSTSRAARSTATLFGAPRPRRRRTRSRQRQALVASMKRTRSRQRSTSAS